MIQPRLALVLAVLSTGLAGCNSGLAALFGASNKDSNAPSNVSALTVANARSSPAQLGFRVIDADGDDAEVKLWYRVGGGPAELVSRIQGENPRRFAGSAGGTQHQLDWDYASEPGLPGGESYTPDVTVWAEIEGLTSIVVGANASALGLGNDAPRVSSVLAPTEEVSGVVPIRFGFEDSSSDLISMQIEWQVVGEDTWQLARPGGEQETPQFAFQNLTAPALGEEANFFWDTNHDLPNLERDVRLRLTPADSLLAGEPRVSQSFRVDNNAAPILDLDNGLIVFGAQDDVGGIALPFSVRDEEGDAVQVVFQWRRAGESFPELPGDLAGLEALLADPAARRAHQVCSTRESWADTRLAPVDADHVRLPELGTTRLSLDSTGLAGRRLEVLRPSELPIAIETLEGTVGHAVAALPLDGGTAALVLDGDGSSWQCLEVDLATGELLRTVGQGIGGASALARSIDGDTLYIACSEGTTWRVERWDARDGSPTGSVEGTFAGADGVRGLAANGGAGAWITVEDRVLELAFREGGASPRVVASGLAGPHGIVADPLERDVVLVAERGADRVVALNTRTGAKMTVPRPDPTPVPLSAQGSLPGPVGLTLDRGGERLSVVCEDGGERQLRVLNRRSPHDLDGSGFANARVFEGVALPLDGGAALHSDGAHVRLLTDGVGGLVVIGGVEQRRRIAQATPTSQVVTLDAPLAPEPTGARACRIERGAPDFPAPTAGAQHVFAWDSGDVVNAGAVFFRATPYDSEAGVESETGLEREVRSERTARETLVEAGMPDVFTLPGVVDWDGDGDLDVLISDGEASRVYLQERRGRFAGTSIPLGVDLAGSFGVELHLADLDGDGHVELVNLTGEDLPPLIDGEDRIRVRDLRLEIFRGTGPGAFEATPETLALPGPYLGGRYHLPRIYSADLDADGRQDLLLTAPAGFYEATTGLYVFWQAEDGSFEATPQVIEPGDASATRDVAIGDIDGDGLLDLCLANNTSGSAYSGGGITVHLQTGIRAFGAPVLLGEFGEPGSIGESLLDTASVLSVDLADVDADGRLDLLAAHGSFQFGFGGDQWPGFAGLVTVSRQLADGSFAQEEVYGDVDVGGQQFWQGGIFGTDYDGDGDVDLLAHGEVGVLLFDGRGDGTLEPAPLRVRHVGGSPVVTQDPMSRLQPADLDGDGDLDLLYRDAIGGDIKISWQSSGHGVESFSAEPAELGVAGFTEGASEVVLADLDADGDLDLATANSGLLGILAGNDVSVFTQLAPRSFGLVPASVGGGGLMTVPSDLHAADIDQDGDRDLLVLSVATNLLHIFEQTASGEFVPLDALPGSEIGLNPYWNAPVAMIETDYDLDGALDLMLAPNRYETVIAYRQSAPGVFAPGFRVDELDEEDAPIWTGPGDLVVGDLDGDGTDELQLATGTGYDPDAEDLGLACRLLAYTLGLEGPAGAPAAYDPGGTHDMYVRDLDGDGLQDLIGIGWESTRDTAAGLLVNLRQEDGSYAIVPQVHQTELGIFANTELLMQPCDFDGDGDLDVVLWARDLESGEPRLAFIEQVAPGVMARDATHEVFIPEGSWAPSPRLDDVDGDGELDLATAAFDPAETSYVRIHWGNQ